MYKQGVPVMTGTLRYQLCLALTVPADSPRFLMDGLSLEPNTEFGSNGLELELGWLRYNVSQVMW